LPGFPGLLAAFGALGAGASAALAGADALAERGGGGCSSAASRGAGAAVRGPHAAREASATNPRNVRLIE